MILDASAILAILFKEPGYERLVERIGSEDRIGRSRPTPSNGSARDGTRRR